MLAVGAVLSSAVGGRRSARCAPDARCPQGSVRTAVHGRDGPVRRGRVPGGSLGAVDVGARVVAVVGARGGVGTSTLAALVARRLAADGRRVVLADLDAAGGGVEVLLGTEAVGGLRWADVAAARDPLGPGDLRGLLPTWHGVHVLGPDRRPVTVPPGGGGAVGLVWPALRAGWDVVVADVPRVALGDPEVRVLLAGAVLLVVTSQDVPGVAGALAVRDAWRAWEASGAAQGGVGGAVRDGGAWDGGGPDVWERAGAWDRAEPGGRAGTALRGVVVRRCARATVAPVEVARALGVRLVATLPTVRALGHAVDRGLGPAVLGPRHRLVRAAGRVAAVVRG